MVRDGNPKSIKKIDDLARGDVTLINRHPGAGSRGLLNRLLKESHIPADQIRGYDMAVNGHLGAAETVAAGQAFARKDEPARSGLEAVCLSYRLASF